MIRLWIKGSVEEAIAAAKERGIPIQDAQTGVSGQTLCNTDHTHYMDVVKWFHEDAKCVMGYGYPHGTLLLYTSGMSNDCQVFSED